MVKGVTEKDAIQTPLKPQVAKADTVVKKDIPIQFFDFEVLKKNKNPLYPDLKTPMRPAVISDKMKTYIKSQEAGERHRTEDGRYVVYRGKADLAADLRNKESKPLLTVGHGHTGRGTITVGYRDLKEGDTITETQTDKLFEEDIEKIETKLEKNEKCPLTKHMTKNQSDAVISYAFNTGVDKLISSDPERAVPESMVECINKGELGKAQAKFNVITSGGLIQGGLAKRRLIEMAIFADGKIYKEAEETFKQNKDGISGYKKLKHIYDINKVLKEYGVNEEARKKIVSRLIY